MWPSFAPLNNAQSFCRVKSTMHEGIDKKKNTWNKIDKISKKRKSKEGKNKNKQNTTTTIKKKLEGKTTTTKKKKKKKDRNQQNDPRKRYSLK